LLPLDEEWLGRWHRSSSKMPEDIDKAGKPAFEQAIISHPQFRA
jgi:queuine tRNA-ribosyltransferase